MRATKIFKNQGTYIVIRQLLSILIVNGCQFEKHLLFGLEECAGRIGNPKQKDVRRVTAFFYGVNIGLIQKNHGLMEKVGEGFGK